MPSGVWRALRGFKTVFGALIGAQVICVGLSPPGGSGAVQLAWDATGEMADAAAIIFGWKVLSAAVV